MTEHQLGALMDYIREVASYEAARVVDSEPDYRRMYEAEKDLRAAFSSGDGLGK